MLAPDRLPLPSLETMPVLDVDPYDPMVVQDPYLLTRDLPHGTQFARANVSTDYYGNLAALPVVVAVGHEAVQRGQREVGTFGTHDGPGLRPDPERQTGSWPMYDDGDNHGRLLNPLQEAMRPRNLGLLQARAVRRFAELLHTVGTEQFDAAPHLGRIVAMGVSDMLGVDPDQGFDPEAVIHLSHVATAAQGPTSRYDHRIGPALAGLAPIYQTILEGRAAEDSAGADISRAVSAGALTLDEAANLIGTIPVAGIRTQQGTLGFLLQGLAQGNQARVLMTNPRLDVRAGREALRDGSSLRYIVRAGPEAFGGRRVLLAQHAGNHDPVFWQDPSNFDVERNNLKHVALGSGLHRCLGNYWAESTVQAFIQALREHRVTGVSIEGDPIIDPSDAAVVAHSQLPVRLTRR